MAKKEALRYRIPDDWLLYDPTVLARTISEAESVVFALTRTPYQRHWLTGPADRQLRSEIAGTCQLAGIIPPPEPGSLPQPDRPRFGTAISTGALRVKAAYEWLGSLEEGSDLSEALICELHRRLVAPDDDGDADDAPIEDSGLRVKGHQAFFGDPLQRGAKGGRECREALSALLDALRATRDTHSPLLRSLAFHYHFLTIHPFADANGRTARALGSVLRQSAGLRAGHFVSMSGFYSSEREAYSKALSASRRTGHDLTAFLEFALHGLIQQCSQLFGELGTHVSIALFENTTRTLFGQIAQGKRTALAHRQQRILAIFLGRSARMPLRDLYGRMRGAYRTLKNPWKAFLRDVSDLLEIGALDAEDDGQLAARLEWPARITPERFLEHYLESPRSGTAATRVG